VRNPFPPFEFDRGSTRGLFFPLGRVCGRRRYQCENSASLRFTHSYALSGITLTRAACFVDLGGPCDPFVYRRSAYTTLTLLLIFTPGPDFCAPECKECKFCKSGKTNLCGKGPWVTSCVLFAPQKLNLSHSARHPGTGLDARQEQPFLNQWAEDSSFCMPSSSLIL
jgi:hypothetical protein